MFVSPADCTTTAAASAAATQNQPPAATDPGESLYGFTFVVFCDVTMRATCHRDRGVS